MSSSSPQRGVGVVLFKGFELLDVFGPVEVFGMLPERFAITLIGPTAGPVQSSQGPRAEADVPYADASVPEIVLVPGGRGTRELVGSREFLGWLAGWSSSAEYVTSVCTGSGLLAAAGLLDGYSATSNKRSFAWAKSQSPKVGWIPEARWVEDRNRWTSSGVSAGIDMALALVSRLHGQPVADDVADRIEYDWHRDPSWDPFAAKNGLATG
jgi:transcriptional regulator GlxA family with amidase domain